MQASNNLCSIDDLGLFRANETSPDGNSSGTVVVSILTSLLALIIAVGNGLIIMSVAVVKKLRQPANYLIVSLALSDFLVGFIVLPLTIVYDIVGEWVFGSMMCDVHVSFDVICCTASIMNLCMISIDRYLIITQPMTYPKRRNGKLMAILIATAWLISCLIIIPALFGFTENVKDEPGWIQLSRTRIVHHTGFRRSKAKQLPWNKTHDIAAALDGNATTFWDPSSDFRNPDDWFFTLDLEHTYRLTKIGLINSGDHAHDILQYIVHTSSCKEELKQTYQDDFFVRAGTTELQEVVLKGDTVAKLIRIRINQTYEDNSPHIREFSAYGEKIGGKTCLISQEVWFTIYSTVGAFYLPLTVMLCMYWKIYMEASRFKARHRDRKGSFSETQEWNCTPPGSPSHSLSGTVRPSSQIFFKKAKHVSNKLTGSFETLMMKQDKSKDNYITDSKSQVLTNESSESNGVTVTITHVYEEEKNNDARFDEDTISSECELLSSEKDDATAICGENKCSRQGVTNFNEDLNGNHEQFQFASLPNRAGRHRHMSLTEPLTPPHGKTNNTNILKPVSILRTRTWSEDSMNRTLRNVNKYKRNYSPNRLNTKEWRYPTISEEIVLDINDKDSSTQVTNKDDLITQCYYRESNLKSNYVRSCSFLETENQSKKNLYQELKQPRHSIFSDSVCCISPLCCKTSSSPSTIFSSTVSTKQQRRRYSNGAKKLLAKSRSMSIESNSLNRRASVFNQIKRKVSMAAPRDRMRNVKATRTLGIIVGAFTFCWLPFFIVTFLRPFVCENPESQDCIPLWLVRLVLWLGYLNSALNPLIYIGFSPDLREAFRFLLSCKCTNVDRRLAQTELRQAISREKRESRASISRCVASESIM